MSKKRDFKIISFNYNKPISLPSTEKLRQMMLNMKSHKRSHKTCEELSNSIFMSLEAIEDIKNWDKNEKT